MSYLAHKESLCPACMLPNEGEVWSSINVQEDPELKDLLLGGELNILECSGCHHFFYAEHFLLYHDPESQLIAFVYPLDHAGEKATWQKKTEDDFAQIASQGAGKFEVFYAPYSLFGLDELVRLVEKDDEASIQSEVAEAVSQEHRLPFKKLAPGLARQQQLPRVLPIKNGLTRASVLSGITELLTFNDRLTTYAEALRHLKANPTKEIRFE